MRRPKSLVLVFLCLWVLVYRSELERLVGSWLGQEEEDLIYSFSRDFQVRLWIDVPNAFPWRECLTIWDNHIITEGCTVILEDKRQVFLLSPLEPGGQIFRLSMREDSDTCLEPQGAELGPHVQVQKPCSPGLGWTWRQATGQLVWEGRCLASTASMARVVVRECSPWQEEQVVEVGEWLEADQPLQPLDLPGFQKRARRIRDRELVLAGEEVAAVLEDIKASEMTGELYRRAGRRRAVVFYLDKGEGFLTYLTWWLHAWRTIGLDSKDEEFDIILMSHPTSIPLLPDFCQPVPQDFNPLVISGPGRCLYRELVSIYERDSRYDHYLNSQECLFNPVAAFLTNYSSLLRADLDTFPTPGLLGLRPEKVICFRNEAYTHHRRDIESAIVASAAAAGISHRRWHNTASSWLGPSRRVVAMARLTTAVSRFLRVHMFGPGTKCRCANCTRLPEDCQWGSGIYAGTLLLYAQEIALNRLWTQPEFKAGAKAVLDGSTTDGTTDICARALLHARHSSEAFSKFAFLAGQYKDWDMATLDISRLRDYSMFLALGSSGQGVHREAALQKFLNATGGRGLEKYCVKLGS